ncbi:MAG: hypothetical protein K6B12_02145 [Clostridiales bacterium]|nr:hypothetical protein [Clostridiales bacterium]
MKKDILISGFAVAAALALTLSGCGGGTETSPAARETAEQESAGQGAPGQAGSSGGQESKGPSPVHVSADGLTGTWMCDAGYIVTMKPAEQSYVLRTATKRFGDGPLACVEDDPEVSGTLTYLDYEYQIICQDDDTLCFRMTEESRARCTEEVDTLDDLIYRRDDSAEIQMITLDQLQGVWKNENGVVLEIEDDEFGLETEEDYEYGPLVNQNNGAGWFFTVPYTDPDSGETRSFDYYIAVDDENSICLQPSLFEIMNVDLVREGADTGAGAGAAAAAAADAYDSSQLPPDFDPFADPGPYPDEPQSEDISSAPSAGWDFSDDPVSSLDWYYKDDEGYLILFSSEAELYQLQSPEGRVGAGMYQVIDGGPTRSINYDNCFYTLVKQDDEDTILLSLEDVMPDENTDSLDGHVFKIDFDDMTMNPYGLAGMDGVWLDGSSSLCIDAAAETFNYIHGGYSGEGSLYNDVNGMGWYMTWMREDLETEEYTAVEVFPVLNLAGDELTLYTRDGWLSELKFTKQ